MGGETESMSHFFLRMTGAALLCATALLLAGCHTSKKPSDPVWDKAIQAGRDAQAKGDRPGAETAFRSAAARAEQTGSREELSASLGALAELAYSQGKLAESAELCRRQIDVDAALLSTNEMPLAQEYSRLGELELRLTNYARALDAFEHAQSITADQSGAHSPLIGFYMARRARTYALQHKNDMAEYYFSRSLVFLEDARNELNFDDHAVGQRRPLADQIAQIRGDFAQYYEELGQLTQAEDCLSRAIVVLESEYGKGCSQTAPLIESLLRVRAKLPKEPRQ